MTEMSASEQIDSIPFPTVTIAGLGLLGGALALALKQKQPATRVLGYARRAETIDQALAAGAIDRGSTDPEEMLAEADLTVVCMPINATIEFCKQNAQAWRRGTMVTDVASTKAELVKVLYPLLAGQGINFLGSHPMAGSEKSGFAAATADLYQDAAVLITPLPENQPEQTNSLFSFWHNLGALPHILDPGAHDALVARTSHLPHLLAPPLLKVALRADRRHRATAGAFRDMTRIAGGSPDMWLDIFEHNQEEIFAALAEFQEELSEFTEHLRQQRWPELKKKLEQARNQRLEWEQKKTSC